MPLLSVQVFDRNKTELYSYGSVSKFRRFFELFSLTSWFAGDQSQQTRVQALIINNQLIAFHNTPNDLLLVGSATLNTSFHELEQFLELLSDSLGNKNPFQNDSTEPFQRLCESIINTVDSTKELKIALLGLDGSGKTTFANYFAENQPLAVSASYLPTSLLNIVKVKRIGDLPFHFQFFDLGMAFQRHWWKFRQACNGFIFFMDSSDSQRMTQAQELFQELRNFWDLPCVIAANKCDISKIVNLRKYIARKLRVPVKYVYETETWNGIGLLSLIKGLVKQEIQAKKIAASLVRSKRTEIST